MILTPWVLGLTLGSVVSLLLLFRAAIPAAVILVRGEDGHSRRQLVLEKQEMLGSTILSLAGMYYLASPFFLSASAFDLGRQIPGAMCALGTFNANAFGFPLLMMRMCGIFLIMAWLALYALDKEDVNTPNREKRRVLLVFLAAWMTGDTLVQSLFFQNLDPSGATSCCAVVFDPTGGPGASPAGFLARFPGMRLFSAAGVLYAATGAWGLMRRKRRMILVYGLISPFFFFFGVAAMISCISPYIYALPHHHCPFCILTGKEGILGIPLALLLYGGTVSGWKAGLMELFSGTGNPGGPAGKKIKKYAVVSVFANAAYVLGGVMIVALYRIFGQLI